MGASRSAGDARELLMTYLRQLKESGEAEIFVSLETIRALQGTTPAEAEERTPPAVANRTVAPPAAGPRFERAEPVRAQAKPTRPERVPAETPRPERVKAELLLGKPSSSPDMFAEPSELDRAASLEEVERIASRCERCELTKGRTKVVFGVGNTSAKLMFIGEAPGHDEDVQGVPFVGRAGQLLNKILDAAGIRRDDVYIGNIIKCRPPNNRTPMTTEIEACMPYLAKQIQCIAPKIICTLGLPATQTLLGSKGPMASLRGKVYECGALRVIPTYHPAAALRDPRYKRPIWEDFLVLKREYDAA